MNFTKGSIKVQSLAQKFAKPPFLITIESSPKAKTGNLCISNLKVFPNPNFDKQPKKYFKVHVSKLNWLFWKENIHLLCFACIFRVFWLRSNWDILNDFEQMGYNALLVFITTIAIFSYQAIEDHIAETCFLVTQTVAIVSKFCIVHSNQTRSTSKYSKSQYLGYACKIV